MTIVSLQLEKISCMFNFVFFEEVRYISTYGSAFSIAHFLF